MFYLGLKVPPWHVDRKCSHELADFFTSHQIIPLSPLLSASSPLPSSVMGTLSDCKSGEAEDLYFQITIVPLGQKIALYFLKSSSLVFQSDNVLLC